MMSNASYRGRACSGQPIWIRSRVVGYLTVALMVGALAALIIAAAVAARPATPLNQQAAPASSGRETPRLSLTKTPGELSTDARFRFISGRSFFESTWVRTGATTTLRDGLGPHFSSRSCAGCHVGAGRSSPTFNARFTDTNAGDLMARFDATDDPKAPLPLGSNWQAFSVPEARPPSRTRVEGQLQSRYFEKTWFYPDGRKVTGVRPDYRLASDHPATITAAVLSVRVAPSLDLAGRIEQVSDHAIVANVDPNDADQNGISGRLHPHLAANGITVAGRFGLKARHPNLRTQVAAALQEDIGVTSSVFPDEACSAAQTRCLSAPNGRGAAIGGWQSGQEPEEYEISDGQLDDLVEFLQTLAVRDQPPSVRSVLARQKVHGQSVFATIGCAQCHVPALKSQRAPVTLFSDLLLHDMGTDLADTGPDTGELSREWRTAPLTNLRLRSKLTSRANYLHDGRASTIEQAVLWHGGEAQRSRDRFLWLPQAQQNDLLIFLGSL